MEYTEEYNKWWEEVAGKRENVRADIGDYENKWDYAKAVSYLAWQKSKAWEEANPEAVSQRQYDWGYDALDKWLANGNKLVGPMDVKNDPDFARGFNHRYEEELAKQNA